MANAKLDIDIGAFQSNIKAAQGVLKGLDAQMKAADATFKATGNSEKQLADKTRTLNSQLQVQKGIADQAKQALKAMDEAGVDPLDASYQKLYATMMTATAGMNNAQAELNALSDSAQGAAGSADQLTTSVQSIGKKISLDQVITGIGKITDGLENAAKKAVKLGEDLWNAIMDSAKWADDTATMAEMYGIDLDTFQRMQKLVTNGLDTSVEAILKSQKKLRKGVGDESKATMEALEELGLAIRSGKEDGLHLVTEDDVDLFWKAGQALMALDDSFDKESMAQSLFGRSWQELVPLFNKYKTLEDYNTALEEQNVVSEESVNNLAALNDKVSELQGNFETLKNEVIGSLAPGLTEAADALNDVLTTVLEYLQTEEGQQMLSDLGESVAELFSGLRDINPQDIVNGFKGVFDTVLGALDWIVNNKDTLIAAVEGIFGVWATLEVSSGVLTILKVIDGLKSLAGIGAGTGAGAGASVSTGISALLTGATTKVAGIAGNGVLQNFIPGLTDWIVHNTGIGQEVFLGTKEKGSTFKEIGENTEQWWNDYKNVLTNARDYWSGIWDQQREAAEWTFGDEYTADELMQMINGGEPVPVEVEPTPEEGAAENIADQVGTITLPVEFQIRSDYVNLQQYILKQMGVGNANGLSYVPNEGLNHLHQGERVVPAREVASRSFSSNLYVENMNMGGGLSADALAAAIAGRNRRMMAGYGS